MQFRNHRYATRYDTTFEADQRDHSGVITSISESGARADIDRPLAVGQNVMLKLPTGPVKATVQWVSDGSAGFSFATELSIAAVDRVRFGLRAAHKGTHHGMQFSVMR